MAKPVWRDADDEDPVVADGGKAYYTASWAVVIGINDYGDQFKRLTHAVSDAVGVAQALITKRGFREDHVYLFINPRSDVPERYEAWLTDVAPRLACLSTTATSGEIEELMLTTLPTSGPDDRIMVYFAGHGDCQKVPGSGGRELPYLVGANGVSKKWHTYIDLKRLVERGAAYPAKHVFYLFDACFSGLLGLRSGDQPTHYEQDMLQLRARRCLTAGTGGQRVEDDGVDGHSTFTHHVLQVLRGVVRPGADELVTASNLSTYVTTKVAGTAYQTPAGFSITGDDGGEFIFFAPEAPLDPEQHATLARILIENVGQPLDEPSPFELSARIWNKLGAAKSATAEQALVARCGAARALLALGEAEDALSALSNISPQAGADTDLLRSIAYLKTNELDAARPILERIAADPAHAYATWASSVTATAGKRRSKRYALLVGVGKFEKNERLQLRGCENDVAGMADVLRNRLEFDHVVPLLNKDATSTSIIDAFDALRRSVRPEDSFVFYFSGNGFLREQQAIFGSYDLDPEAGVLLSERDIDALMKGIPARDKLIITDGCYLAPPVPNLSLGYRYLSGCGRKETAYEVFAPGGPVRGAFSHALEQVLHRYGNAPMELLFEQIRATMASPRPQTPGYTGTLSAPFVRDYHPAFEIIDLATRGCSRQFSANQLEDFTSWMRDHQVTATPLWLGIGRAWMAKGRGDDAVKALTSAERTSSALPLVKSHLLSARYPEALASLRSFAEGRSGYSDATLEQSLDELLPLLERLIHPTAHALLVGVGAETQDAWTSDPAPQLAAIQRALAHAGYSDITVAPNARRTELLAAFEELIARAGDAPAFFLFIGPGFDDTELWLSSADGAELWFSDVPLSELRTRAAACSNLTSAILLTQLRGPRSVGGVSAPCAGLAQLGVTTVVAAPQQAREIADFDGLGPPPPKVAGLVDMLDGLLHAQPALSASDWLNRAGFPEGVTIRGERGSPMFSYRSDRGSALELHREIEQAPLRLAEELLTKLTEDPALAASAWLHRGVVRAEFGRHVEALADIDAALKRYRADHGEQVEDDDGVVRWAEAHYHRGKILLKAHRCSAAEEALAVAVDILLEARRRAEAEAARGVAVDEDGDRYSGLLARAHYYHGRAIRGLIDTDLEQKARESRDRYVALGAPLGFDDLEPEKPTR